MTDPTLGTFATPPTSAANTPLTLDAIRGAAEQVHAFRATGGTFTGPWAVARDVWDALNRGTPLARFGTGDVYLDDRLPPGTYYEGKPGAPRVLDGTAP